MHDTWVDYVAGFMMVVMSILLVVALLGAIAQGVYCATGDVESPRYQYICGHSVDIK